jgi:hypothetical protein
LSHETVFRECVFDGGDLRYVRWYSSRFEKCRFAGCKFAKGSRAPGRPSVPGR